MRPAVVVGLDGPTGLQAARVFASQGIQVVGIGEDLSHPCARTRVCAHRVESDLSGPALVETLLDPVADLVAGTAVLVPCNDRTVITLARWQGVLRERGFRFVLPDVKGVETLLDKACFSRFTREKGFSVPETRVLQESSDLAEVEEALTFPCILKPTIKTPAWEREAPGKAIRLESPSDLRRIYRPLLDLTPSLVIQEWVYGGDESHFSCNVYLDRDGHPLATFTTRKLRQWPPKVGQGCLSVECRDDTVTEMTLELFRAAEHRGLGYLEVKRDERTGQYVILEANVGRPTGRSAAAEASGVQLLRTLYQDALERPLPRGRAQTFRGVKWIHLRKDLQASARLWRRDELSLRQWWRSVRGPRVHALFSWTDPLPGVLDLMRSVGKYLAERAGRDSGKKESPSRDEDPTPVASSAATPAAPATKRRAELEPSSGDYDIQGFLGVRLVGPSRNDVREAERVLGQPTALLEREPEVVIRFVEDLPGAGPVEFGDPPVDHEGQFWPIQEPGGASPIQVRMKDGGRSCDVLARRDGGGVPLLQELLDVTALANGWVPLHASAWVHQGRGVLAVGLEGSGKTGALLAFAGRGASVVGDDRIYVRQDGARMVGLPRPLTVKDWHVAELPWLADHLGSRRRIMARAAGMLRIAEDRIPNGDGGDGHGTGLLRHLLKKSVGRLRRSLTTDRDPSSLVGSGRCPGEGVPDVLFTLAGDGGSGVRLEEIDGEGVASRLAAAVSVELSPLLRAYHASRFTHSGEPWPALERAEALATEILRPWSSEVCAFQVRHPYPSCLHDLSDAMESVVARSTRNVDTLPDSTPVRVVSGCPAP